MHLCYSCFNYWPSRPCRLLVDGAPPARAPRAPRVPRALSSEFATLTLFVGGCPLIHKGAFGGKPYSSYWLKFTAAWLILAAKMIETNTSISSAFVLNFPFPVTPLESKQTNLIVKIFSQTFTKISSPPFVLGRNSRSSFDELVPGCFVPHELLSLV